MLSKRIFQFMLFQSIFLFSSLVIAASSWQIQPEKSSIKFTATQNNAPVTGNFSKFSGDVDFDPDQLNSSKVRILVDMNSVTASFNDVATTLKTADWFNVKMFPQAEFAANQFVKIGDKKYQAKGTLKIRDKTIPVTLDFILKDYSTHQAQVEGSTILKRTLFGIGQGEWSNTNAIKDDVLVKFQLTVTK
jgi:polyisoprenoid-binding protein YceI